MKIKLLTLLPFLLILNCCGNKEKVLSASTNDTDNLPQTFIVLSTEGYKSAQEAAQAAETIAARLSSAAHIEYGGVIEHYQNKYYYTNAVTIYSRSSVNFYVKGVASDSVVAMYHTHPVGPELDAPSDTEKFSFTDIRTATVNNIDSYIWSEFDNSIRVYIPGKSIAIPYGDDYGNILGFYSMGTVVFYFHNNQ